MLDRFEVFRDAEKIVQSWGPVDYLFPHQKGDRFKCGDRIGVVVHYPSGLLRYGQMEFGYKETLKERKGMQFIYEDELLTGGKYEKIFKTRRCLIPVDRWYFHQRKAMGTHWLCFHPIEKSTMAFAGLFSTIAHASGTKVNTVAIIGLSSGDFYREYYERMPAVFLPGPDAIRWLDPKLPEPKAWELLRSFPSDKMMAEPCTEWGGIGE